MRRISCYASESNSWHKWGYLPFFFPTESLKIIEKSSDEMNLKENNSFISLQSLGAGNDGQVTLLATEEIWIWSAFLRENFYDISFTMLLFFFKAISKKN